MKHIAAYCLSGIMMFSLLNAAEKESVSGDAALFAGKGSTGERYFRLGELALENDDAAGAADFFKQSIPGLKDENLKLQATDRLLESLLAVNRIAEGEKLLKACKKDQLFVRSNMFKLMEARMLLYQHKNTEAVKLLHDLTLRLDPAQATTFPALELLSKALSNMGNYSAARKAALDMAVISGNDGLKKFKSLEGLIFLALANNDQKQALQAYEQLISELPADIRSRFSDRIKKLSWLVACSTGKGKDIESEFLKRAESSPAPDPLLARIAYTLAAEQKKDPVKAVKYAELAYKFAEAAFMRTTLQRVIQLEIDGKFFLDALNDALKFQKIFPDAPGQDMLAATIGDLYVRLGRNNEAVKTFSKLCKDEKATIALRCSAAGKLARLYQKQSKVPEASAMFKFAIENSSDKSLKSAYEYEFGEYLYNLGRYNDAAGYFRKAAENSKDKKNSLLYLAQSLYMLKSYEQAHKVLLSIDIAGNKDMAMRKDYLDALITEQLGKKDEAIGKFSAFAKTYAASKEAPEALFHAGTLALSSKKFNGQEMLQLYAKRYPGEKAANALYKVINAELIDNKEAEAKTLLAGLSGKYPESKFTIAGNFRMVDFLHENKRYKEALDMLENISKRYGTVRSELIPEILYDQAVIYGALNDHANKLKALEEMVKKYADHPMAGRAFFMLGDLKAAMGDPEAALAAFQQAKKRSDGVFAYGCTGRAGDAAYTLYSKNRKEEYLLQARELYESLLKNNDLPSRIRMQTLYKLGRCLEEAADSAGALRKYREVIYQAVLCRRQGSFYPEIWCIKALDAALKMLLQAVREAPTQEQAQQLKNGAVRLLKSAAELDLPGEDINKQLELVERTYPAAKAMEE